MSSGSAFIAVWLVCVAPAATAEIGRGDVDEMHVDALTYPTAETCARCHPNHYSQWSVSPHSYALMSPVFNAMQATVTRLTNGTNGDFCIRCHSVAGMSLGEPTFTATKNREPISREGVTCIVCHRVNRSYGKISGRFPVKQVTYTNRFTVHGAVKSWTVFGIHSVWPKNAGRTVGFLFTSRLNRSSR